MTPQIKQRIEQIQRGEVPQGYKKTKIGVIPEEWEETKFEKIFSERNESKCDDMQLLSITGEKGIIPRSQIEGKDNSSKDKSKYKHICVGDIGYNTMRMWQGVSALSSYEGIISPAYTVLVPKGNICGRYFSYLFKLQKQIDAFYRNSQGLVDDTRSLKYEWFKIMDVAIPPLAEQQKIAEILTCQDKKIELYQKKIEELKKLKKAYLSKMFPKKDSNVPELRFKGFTEPWKQRKLGDVGGITMGQSPDGSTYSEHPSDFILVQGNADLKDGWVCPRVWTTQKTKTAEAGDLIMSVRAPAGAMGKTAYNVVLGRGVAGIKGNEFIFQTLVKMDSDGYWKKLAAGSTFESINSDAVSNATIFVPQDIAEQNKIGEYFRNLDNLITLHQRKVKEMQNEKKALMQLLLTGIVRV